MAEYRRGSGPDALPQGAASALNAAAAPPIEAANADIPVVFAPGEEDPIPDDDKGLDEDQQVLVEGPYAGFRAQPKDRAGRVPRSVVRHLPQLQAAARDPSAHPTLRAYYVSVVRNLEIELSRGGR